MKTKQKNISFLLIALLTSFVFNSCIPEQEFDSSLLIGKWVSGSEYYRYMQDGTGLTWDTADDVDESEAQAFTWTLVQSTLTHIHILEIGGLVPKVYTVTKLTHNTLEYEDEFGKTHRFSKSES